LLYFYAKQKGTTAILKTYLPHAVELKKVHLSSGILKNCAPARGTTALVANRRSNKAVAAVAALGKQSFIQGLHISENI
jgi:hypothetical protein